MFGSTRAALVAALIFVTPPLVQYGRAQDSAVRIPLAPGLAIVSTLHDGGLERESVVTVEEASPAGVRYVWQFLEVDATGDTIEGLHARFVSAADLAGAPRLHTVHETNGPIERPGYTAWGLSTAVYRQVRAEGHATFQIMAIEGPNAAVGGLAELVRSGFGSSRPIPVRWRGTLIRTSAAPEPFPLLVNGSRVAVPVLRLRGRFVARQGRWEPEIWVLADSSHPLVLKLITPREDHVYQIVRVDLLEGLKLLDDPQAQEGPEGETGGSLGDGEDDGEARQGVGNVIGAPGSPAGTPGTPKGPAAGIGGLRGAGAVIESALAAACRVELPGIYFAFNSAELDPVSDRTIASLARMLTRHPDWGPTIEGHTDSIGTASANQVLSERRAEAVRNRLVTRHGLQAAKLGAVGFGASRPRESNATIEGRARNRRVELVRECAGAENKR